MVFEDAANRIHENSQALIDLFKQKVDALELACVLQSGYSVDARMGDLDTLEHHQSHSFDVTVYKNQKTASASTSDLAWESLKSTVLKACDLIDYMQPDACSGLADSNELLDQEIDLDLYHPWQLDTQAAIALALACDEKARAVDKRIKQTDSASVSTHDQFYLYGNSLGFLKGYRSSRHSISCVLVGEQQGHMVRDYEYTMSRDPKQLASVDDIAEATVKKTVQRLGAKSLPTQQCPVIFHASVASHLWGALIAAINGTNLYRGSSFLCDYLGKTIFPSNITIHQRPHRPKEIGSTPFDREGVVTRNLAYIEEGQLLNYVLDSYSARRLNLTTTGNCGGVYNLLVNPTTDATLNDLLHNMGEGLLVTELIGQGINLMTGDYSKGACGFWVSNGQIQYPVEQVTIAGDLKTMFANTLAVASDVDARANIKTGSVWIEKMTVSGMSE